VFVLVLALLSRKPPYECPPGKSIAATVKRHSDAGPILVTLEAAGIDTQVAEETAKSLWRRLPFLLYNVYRPHEPPGPWHVVVPSERLVEAQRLLRMGLGGQRADPA
jgi:hypothetical protein